MQAGTDGISPLFKFGSVPRYNRRDLISTLLANRASIENIHPFGNWNVLFWALTWPGRRDPEQAGPLAHILAAKDERIDVNKKINGESLLHLAIKLEHPELQVILEAKADIEAVDQEGNTPYQLAYKRYNQAAMQLLIEAKASTVLKADPNADKENQRQWSILRRLILQSDQEAVASTSEEVDIPAESEEDGTSAEVYSLLLKRGGGLNPSKQVRDKFIEDYAIPLKNLCITLMKKNALNFVKFLVIQDFVNQNEILKIAQNYAVSPVILAELIYFYFCSGNSLILNHPEGFDRRSTCWSIPPPDRNPFLLQARAMSKAPSLALLTGLHPRAGRRSIFSYLNKHSALFDAQVLRRVLALSGQHLPKRASGTLHQAMEIELARAASSSQSISTPSAAGLGVSLSPSVVPTGAKEPAVSKPGESKKRTRDGDEVETEAAGQPGKQSRTMFWEASPSTSRVNPSEDSPSNPGPGQT